MFRKLAIISLLGTIAVGGLALAQTFAPDMPILGGPSYCVTTVNGVCQQTVPAGPGLTSNETVPADTNAVPPGGIQSGKIPVAVLYNDFNGLIGGDFGQNLWQRFNGQTGAAAFAAITPTSATMTADGWYVIEQLNSTAAQTVTVTKQTGVADQPPGSSASYRLQRPNAQTLTNQVCVGQLLPDDSSDPYINTVASTTNVPPAGVRTAIFSVEMLAGANFSSAGVNMIIASHSAADVTTGATSGQGTNTATFASSLTGTQNISNYTENINTLMIPTTSWTRYSVAVQIPYYITGTTQTLGVGVKLCVTPVGTAGANDWVEFGNAQLEYRGGTTTASSPFKRLALASEWNREYARYWSLFESGAGTAVYCAGQGTTTSGFNVVCPFPTQMRITPVVSPTTAGGFSINAAGTDKVITNFNNATVTQTPRAGVLSGTAATSITAGQGTTLVGTGGAAGVLGVIGWSAEP